MKLDRTTLMLAAVVVLVVTGIGAAPVASGASQSFPQAGVILSSKLAARSAPSDRARVLKIFSQFRPDFRTTGLLAVGEARDASGALWLHVSLPMRPNGRYGWVRASLVDAHPVTQKIIVSRGARVLSLFENDRLVFRTRVAVGKRGAETPLGLFYIAARYRATESALGAYAFETSAYSRLSEWPGGGIVGIHGTPWPRLLGQAVSHGCIRVSNAAALTLKRLVPVGTPVLIVA